MKEEPHLEGRQHPKCSRMPKEALTRLVPDTWWFAEVLIQTKGQGIERGVISKYFVEMVITLIGNIRIVFLQNLLDWFDTKKETHIISENC